jgi:FixJ family two-component response regulator
MSATMFTVFVVDDDVGVLNALSRLLRVRGYDVRSYTSPHAFLEDHDMSVPGCAVLDVAMPGLDGLALLGAIARAVEQDSKVRQVEADLKVIRAKIATLTPREREVLTHVVAGRLNKQIAGDLGTAEKTIKVHRGRVMEKLGVRTIADLVRLAEKAGISR